MDTITTKVTFLIRRLTENNYTEWNWNICAILHKQKLWKYTLSEWKFDEKLMKADWEEKLTNMADLMTPMITALIQAKLTKEEFNNGYKIYKRLKELLQPLGETQFICLTQEYYILNYHNFKDVSKFLDHVKSLEKQIDTTNVKMTPNKQILLYLTMVLWNKFHYQSLV